MSNSENKYTAGELKYMQSMSLESKIEFTKRRIRGWYESWVKYEIYNTKTGESRFVTGREGELPKLRENEVCDPWDAEAGQVYVSFSGGKDSTVLLDLVRRIYPDVPAVFIDTGLEYPELRDFVKSIPNVTWIKPEMNFRKVIETYGYPIISKRIASYISSAKNNPDCVRAKYLRGEIDNTMFGGGGRWSYLIDSPFKISDYCCDKMKKQPNKHFAKESGLKPIFGTMACESQNRKQSWLRNGCNVFDNKEPKSQPISFWTEQDILKYLYEYKIPYASVYGDIVQENGKYKTTGCHRTGCIYCAFGAHLQEEPNRFQRLKETHPQLWSYCMKPWDEGGLGMKEVLDYIGVKTE